MRPAGFLLALLALATAAAAQETFDAAAWRAAKDRPGPESPRAAMVEDLQQRVLRDGATRDEIVALLGPPDDERGGRLVYLIGAPGMGVDLEGLVLLFDEEGRLTRTQRVRY